MRLTSVGDEDINLPKVMNHLGYGPLHLSSIGHCIIR